MFSNLQLFFPIIYNVKLLKHMLVHHPNNIQLGLGDENLVHLTRRQYKKINYIYNR